MTSLKTSAEAIPGANSRAAIVTMAIALAMIVVLATSAQAQTYTVLHTFNGANDGGVQYAGLTIDRAGNLYGTNYQGGRGGGGTVYELARRGSGWIFTTLHAFQGGNDGKAPQARVVFGPNGKLYGTTMNGGTGRCGTVFSLTPPPTTCGSTGCSWTETVIHTFSQNNYSDGCWPGFGDLVFDSAGNLYGTTNEGGGTYCFENGCGTVFEISPSNGGWSESVLYAFSDYLDHSPWGGVTFDDAGNLYGTTTAGYLPERYGAIYQLTPGSPYWSETPLHSFSADGYGDSSNLLRDSLGNFYGANLYGTTGGVFAFSNSEGIRNFTLLYPDIGGYGPLFMDQAGNIYGTTLSGGAHQKGNVYKLTPSNGLWTYTSLYDFTGGSDGGVPWGNVTMDAAGNLYGTTAYGGVTNAYCGAGCGVVWEITP